MAEKIALSALAATMDVTVVNKDVTVANNNQVSWPNLVEKIALSALAATMDATVVSVKV